MCLQHKRSPPERYTTGGLHQECCMYQQTSCICRIVRRRTSPQATTSCVARPFSYHYCRPRPCVKTCRSAGVGTVGRSEAKESRSDLPTPERSVGSIGSGSARLLERCCLRGTMATRGLRMCDTGRASTIARAGGYSWCIGKRYINRIQEN